MSTLNKCKTCDIYFLGEMDSCNYCLDCWKKVTKEALEKWMSNEK